MDEYIKLEDAIAIIEEKQKELCPVGRYGRGYVYGSDRDKYDAWDEIIDTLENISSDNVSPVVRCKDYKWHEPCTDYGLDKTTGRYDHSKIIKMSYGECHGQDFIFTEDGCIRVGEDDFCSYGERKEAE